MAETIQERIIRYLDDTIALEAAAVTGLKDMAEEAVDPAQKALYQQHLVETERQKARLEARITELGGAASNNVLKNLMNKVGVAATDLLHAGKDSGDKATRNLIQAYAIENLEVATYESLYSAATEAGDTATAALAREIQAEEKAAAEKVFSHIADAARAALVGSAVESAVV
jgi:ferritin-like metal-binding protein YciE